MKLERASGTLGLHSKGDGEPLEAAAQVMRLAVADWGGRRLRCWGKGIWTGL